MAGGALGVLLTEWGIRIFVALAPEWLLPAGELVVDVRVLAFALGVSLLTGIIFGLAPAWRASRAELTESLKEGGGRSGVTGPGRGRSFLLVSEVALAIVLLLGAGLMMNSFLRLQRVDVGLNPKNLLTAEVFLGGRKYWDHQPGDKKQVKPQGDIYFADILENVRNLPGVTAAGFMTRLPTDGSPSRMLQIVGRPQAASGEEQWAVFNEVTPGLLELLDVPLRQGRTIAEQDVEGAPWVIVVNETFVKKFFPDEEPIGQLVQLSIATGSGVVSPEEKPRQIVGVVGDVKHWSLRIEAPPAMYGPNRQHPWVYPGGFYVEHYRQHLVVKTAGDPMALAGAVRQAVAKADADQPAYDFMTMEQRLAASLGIERFSMRLFGTFAILAIVLASVGIYGVMAHVVTQRTHEIGVRRALGALDATVLGMVMRQGLKLTAIGIAIGLLASWGLTRLVAGMLFGVSPTDPVTFAVVVAVMLVVAVMAIWLPARRASRIDPLTALRYE
jgi:putative ABC transport system permease protein